MDFDYFYLYNTTRMWSMARGGVEGGGGILVCSINKIRGKASLYYSARGGRRRAGGEVRWLERRIHEVRAYSVCMNII